MGLRITLILLPLVVMLISILMGGGGASLLTTQSQAIFCNGANPGFATCTNNSGNGTVTISCPADAGGGHCFITSPCPSPPYPSPAYCYSPANAVYLNAGASVILPSSQASSGTNGAFFSFSALNVEGFIPWIIIAVGVAVIASLGFLGSGVGTEGVHILFEAGMLIGIWTLLAVIEGFARGDSASFFVQLNNAIPGSSIGTLGFLFLSLVYGVGILGTISRGA